jgi:uncharacterized heparinase superfamily protein
MNGVSLLFGAFYFRESNFIRLSAEILDKETDEQILNDGGHFELSPMYHSQILSILLDCINLLVNNPGVFAAQEELLEKLREKTSLMLGWLENITLPGGEIPLLNDSANGVYPETGELTEYAGRLGIYAKITRLSDSGYRRFDNGNYTCITDVGKIGPDYIPGHAHADTFSFVLCIGEKQVVVDRGVFTYERSKIRQHDRETSSHNTVTVDGKSSSDVWGGFRVGKRANVKILAENESEIIAEHDGYRSCGTIHTRHFVFNVDSITISDNLTGNHQGTVNLHFHPERIVQLSGKKIVLDCCTIELNGFSECCMKEYSYHPGFNMNVKSGRFEGIFSGSCEMKIITG